MATVGGNGNDGNGRDGNERQSPRESKHQRYRKKKKAELQTMAAVLLASEYRVIQQNRELETLRQQLAESQEGRRRAEARAEQFEAKMQIAQNQAAAEVKIIRLRAEHADNLIAFAEQHAQLQKCRGDLIARSLELEERRSERAEARAQRAEDELQAMHNAAARVQHQQLIGVAIQGA